MFITIASLIFSIALFIAIREWIQRKQLSSSSHSRLFKKISQFIVLQQWDRAIKELDLLKTKRKSGKEITLFEVQVLQGTGRYHEALQQVTVAKHHYPEELLFRLEEGKILLQLEQPKEALEAFYVCAPIIRQEIDFYFLALAQFKVARTTECLELLRPFLTITQNTQMLALAGEAFYENKKFNEAIKVFTTAMQLGDHSHRNLIQLGHSFRRLGNLAEAEKIFRELLVQNCSDCEAILGLGSCLEERGNHYKAFFIYQSGPKKNPILLQKIGSTALRIEKYKVAELAFFELLQSQGPNIQLMTYYAFSLEAQKKWQEAEQFYLKLIHLYPSQYQGYRALAWLFGVGLSQTLSQKEGLNFAYRSLKLKNDALSWEILSACCARIGDFDKAYQIQDALSKQDSERSIRIQRQQCLRHLRKRIPLNDHLVLRSQVA